MVQSTGSPGRKQRTILVVEDNELNREILAEVLSADYQVLTAKDGLEGLQLLSQHCLELSLVILDLFMPVCDGFQFLEKVRGDELMSAVPVVVATGSDKQEDETRCLRLGAVDFVVKPYNPEVVLSRIGSIIRLRESSAMLSVIERDELTRLYTMEAFCHHVQQEFLSSPAGDTTLVVTDVREFKTIATVYGRKEADQVLIYLAGSLPKALEGCIRARQGDKFFLYFHSRDDLSTESIEKHLKKVVAGAPVPNLRLKVGIYRHVDTSQPVQVLCDRVTLAADSVKPDFRVNVACYDEAMEARMMENSRIEAVFSSALREGEFQPYYQPKVDPATGRIVGAEALARWIQPDGRMMPPGKFIPLLEQDGQIGALDEAIYREICLFQSRRLREEKNVVPVSVNLSRNSFYRGGVLERYCAIARDAGVPLELVPIELTETVTNQSEEALRLTRAFYEAGFRLHMDDFGTGYTSLTSLTTIPFSVIKLDKSLTDQIGQQKADIVIRYMMRIAHEIGEKVVAEGVENQRQVDFLRENGCDAIQGYFFYRPMPAESYEKALDENAAPVEE